MEYFVYGMAFMLVSTMLGLWWVRRRAHRLVEELIEAIRERERQDLVLLTVEEIDGMIYGWDMINQEFVCQGRSAAELSASFGARYPTRSAAVAAGPEELLQRLRQQNRARESAPGELT